MIRRFLAPFLVLAAVVASDLYLTSRHGISWREDPRLLRGLRFLAGLTFLLAWRLRRGRVAWVLVATWAVAEASLRVDGFAGGSGAALVVGLAAAVLLPLHFAAAAMLREWWLASRAGLWRLGALGAEGILLTLLASESGRPMLHAVASWLRALRSSAHSLLGARWPDLGLPGLVGSGTPLDEFAVPLLRLAAFVAAASAIAWALRRQRSPLEAGFLAALVALFPATLRTDLVVLCFGAAVLVLAVALVENAVRLAFDDGLTGLPGRRALEESLGQLGGTFSLAMVDIDHFKKLNDRHGHEVGDQVLRKVAARLERVRGGRAFRYGGEEFTLVFAGRGADEAEAAAEDVRAAVADEPFTVRSPTRPKRPSRGRVKRGQGGGEKSLKVTVSAGVAERSDRRPTPDAVLKAADKALYRSKKAGRNRVSVSR